VDRRRRRRSALEEVMTLADPSLTAGGQIGDEDVTAPLIVEDDDQKTEDVTAEDLQLPFRCRCVFFLPSSSLSVTLPHDHEEDSSEGGSVRW
ncbi:hypothetical protein PIB30_109972, partial [Stylosanthes scabra]|nr:hypothetical protein [Stylosanthes scabra]